MPLITTDGLDVPHIVQIFVSVVCLRKQTIHVHLFDLDGVLIVSVCCLSALYACVWWWWCIVSVIIGYAIVCLVPSSNSFDSFLIRSLENPNRLVVDLKVFILERERGIQSLWVDQPDRRPMTFGQVKIDRTGTRVIEAPTRMWKRKPEILLEWLAS